MNNWWKKRIISVYIPYWITCIFLLPTKSYFAPFELDKLQDLILDLTLVKPYFGLGWYLSYLVLQYILFWGLHKVIKNTKTRLAILALISVLFAMYFNRMSYIRFEQAFSFTAGVLIADYESVMEKYFFRKEVIFVLLISGIFLLGIKQVNFVREMSQTVLNILNLFIKEFIGMGLVVAVIVFKKYNISNWLISILNSVITLLGRISYELYLAHGYALMVFKLNLSKFVGVIVFIECTIAGTLFLYYINKKISVLLKKRIFK